MLTRDAKSKRVLSQLRRKSKRDTLARIDLKAQIGTREKVLAEWAGATANGEKLNAKRLLELRERTMKVLDIDPDVTGPW